MSPPMENTVTTIAPAPLAPKTSHTDETNPIAAHFPPSQPNIAPGFVATRDPDMATRDTIVAHA
jgi:hypothetical protein